jgi:hypothetical protein
MANSANRWQIVRHLGLTQIVSRDEINGFGSGMGQTDSHDHASFTVGSKSYQRSPLVFS